MHSRLLPAALAALAFFAPPRAHAQPASGHPEPRLSFAYVTIPGPPSKLDSKTKQAADTLFLVVHVEIADGWHINSDAPKDEFLVPTTVDVKADGIRFDKPRYPKPEIQKNEVMGELSLFSGANDIYVPAKRAGKPSAGAPRTSVTLHYQSCNNSMCLPPKSVTVEQ